jgi:hypothetical protein
MKDLFIAYHAILCQESQPLPDHEHYRQICALLPAQRIKTIDDYLTVVARYFTMLPGQGSNPVAGFAPSLL